MSEQTREITALLARAQRDRGAAETLFRQIETQLHQIAQRQFARERPGHSLQATILVDEAFQRLVSGQDYCWEDRQQFFTAAARLMRRLLVDHARKRDAVKRGGGQRVASLQELDTRLADGMPDPQRIVELSDLIEKLEQQHPDAFAVFNMHYFMGCELKEIADDIMDIPYVRAKRLWQMAKAFLRSELIGDREDGGEESPG